MNWFTRKDKNIQNSEKKEYTNAVYSYTVRKGGSMIIFGHTPREWTRRVRYHKKPIIACIVSFILGAVIF